MIAISTYDNVVDFILSITFLAIVCLLVGLIVLGAATLYFEIMGRVHRRRAAKWARRSRLNRKNQVFHILYGGSPDATAVELEQWRAMCARYINGEIDSAPLTLQEFREDWQ
jgi:hypothetical protein